MNTANLINAATGDKLHIEDKEGQVDMWNAIDEMREESFKEGFEKGFEEGRIEGYTEVIGETRLASIKSIMEKLAYTAKQAMDLLNIPESDQEKYLSKL